MKRRRRAQAVSRWRYVLGEPPDLGEAMLGFLSALLIAIAIGRCAGVV